MEGRYEKKDIIALLVIPLELLIGNYLGVMPFLKGEPLRLLLASTLLFVAGFLILTGLYRRELREAWRKYKQHLLVNLLLAAGLVVGAILLLSFVRGAIPQDLLTKTTAAAKDNAVGQDSFVGNTLLLAMFLGALPSFLSPFSEELVFRFLMVGKARNLVLRFVMLFVQAALFGLIHLNNFGGNVYATIPYMAVGLYFGLIYLVYRNIWGSIMVHWIFNSINGMVPTLVMIVTTLLGITN